MDTILMIPDSNNLKAPITMKTRRSHEFHQLNSETSLWTPLLCFRYSSSSLALVTSINCFMIGQIRILVYVSSLNLNVNFLNWHSAWHYLSPCVSMYLKMMTPQKLLAASHLFLWTRRCCNYLISAIWTYSVTQFSTIYKQSLND